MRSKWNSSMLSRSHYGKMDPNGECITNKSCGEDNLNESFILDRDTLDLIRPDEIRRSSVGMNPNRIDAIFNEEETKLCRDEVDEEWEKFLGQAKECGANPQSHEDIRVKSK